jgi:hypothetical protein
MSRVPPPELHDLLYSPLDSSRFVVTSAPLSPTPLDDAIFVACSKAETGRATTTTKRCAVAVRIRPLTAKERKAKDQPVVSVKKPHSVAVEGQIGFEFLENDYCFDAHEDEKVVFEALAVPTLTAAWSGYNTTLVSFGNGGTGKSYTMYGNQAGPTTSAAVGIVSRVVDCLFRSMNRKRSDIVRRRGIDSYHKDVSFQVALSFVAVQGEKFVDLLNRSNDANVCINEQDISGVTVAGATFAHATTPESAMSHLQQGLKAREQLSHTILTVLFTQHFNFKMNSTRLNRGSKMCFVDLVGVQPAADRQGAAGELKQKHTKVARSMEALSQCLKALSDNAKGGTKGETHIPYRSSLITTVLKEALAGNSQTILLATVSPAKAALFNTKRTLQEARMASSISTTVAANETDTDRLMQCLRAQGGMMEIEQRERTKEADDVVERAEQEVANSIRELGEAQQQLEEAKAEGSKYKTFIQQRSGGNGRDGALQSDELLQQFEVQQVKEQAARVSRQYRVQVLPSMDILEPASTQLV